MGSRPDPWRNWVFGACAISDLSPTEHGYGKRHPIERVAWFSARSHEPNFHGCMVAACLAADGRDTTAAAVSVPAGVTTENALVPGPHRVLHPYETGWMVQAPASNTEVGLLRSRISTARRPGQA